MDTQLPVPADPGRSSMQVMNQDKSNRAFKISLVVAAFCAIVGLTVGWRISTSPSTRYRLLKDRTQLRYVLAKHVRNGDSIEKIESLLGATFQRSTQGAWIEAEMQHPESERYKILFLPSGLEFTDEILHYPDSLEPPPDQRWLLQFRNGKLINLPEEWIASHYGESAKQSSRPRMTSRFYP